MLCGFLDMHRADIVMHLDGLTEEQAKRHLVASDTTLLGMVKHLAYAEHYWFTQIFSGDDAGSPRPDQAWDVTDDTIPDVVQLYDESCARSRAVIDAASLDDYAKPGGVNRRGPTDNFTLRWIMLHMIEEVAQHNGHADILREQLTSE